MPPLPITQGIGNVFIKQITAGGTHSLALAANGTVYAFGQNTVGQLGRTGGNVAVAVAITALINKSAQYIAAGSDYSIVLLGILERETRFICIILTVTFRKRTSLLLWRQFCWAAGTRCHPL